MLIDLHMHTGYSDDAAAHSVEDKVRACIDRGLSIIAITDHLDFWHHLPPQETDIDGCLRDMNAAKTAFADQIELLTGVEIGQIHADPRAAEFLRTRAFDTVIGSLHGMPNDVDIYFHDFKHIDCDAFLQDYFDELLRMVRHGGFDVLAHIDYPLRVMRHGDYIPSFDRFMTSVQAVLRETVARGYALELNAAGLFGWQKRVGPPENVLYEFKRLGGERISIGSDSHAPNNVGRGIEECIAHAKRAGFNSVTVFRQRRAEQVMI